MTRAVVCGGVALVPRAAGMVETSKGWSDSVAVSPGASLWGVSEGDRGRATGMGGFTAPGAPGTASGSGSVVGNAAVTAGPSAGGASMGTSSADGIATKASAGGSAEGSTGTSPGSTDRASGTGADASRAVGCAALVRNAAAWPDDNCRLATITTTAVSAAALVPAMIGVSAGVGRYLGPMADIQAKRAATMKMTPPSSARSVWLTRTPPNTTSVPTRSATIIASDRVMTKARMDRTLYRNTHAQLSVILHTTLRPRFTMPDARLIRGLLARPSGPGG